MTKLLPNIRLPNPLHNESSCQEGPERLKRELKNEFFSEAEAIKASVNDVILHDKARQFFKLVRRSLEKLFSINYECTFEELKKEIEGRDFDKTLKGDLRVFLEELERFEYDFPGFEDEQRRKKSKEREEIMHYLHELEEEGKKIEQKIS